jgi:hypothetical protein
MTGSVTHQDSGNLLTRVRLETGESYVDLDGTLGPAPEFIGSDLRVDLDIPDLSGISILAERTEIPALPVKIIGNVGLSSTALLFNNIDVDFAKDHFLLTGQWVLDDEFYGSEAELTGEIASLRDSAKLFDVSRLPDLPATVKADMALTEEGLEIISSSVRLDGVDLSVEGQVSLADKFLGTRIRTRSNLVNVGRVAEWFEVSGLPALPARLNADLELSGNGLKFAATNSRLGKLDFSLDGTLPDLQAVNQVTTAFSLSVPVLRQAPFLTTVEHLPDLPVTATGTVSIRDRIFEFTSVEGVVGEARFEVDLLLNTIDQFNGSRLKFSIAAPDINPLLPPDIQLPMASRIKASGEVHHGSEEERISDLHIELGEIQAHIDGTLAGLDLSSSADLAVQLSGPDLSVLNAFSNIPLPGEPFSLETSVSRQQQFLQFKPLSMGLGSSNLSGELRLDLDDGPAIEASLHSDRLNIAWLTQEDESAQVDSDEAAPSSDDEMMFRDEDIPDLKMGGMKLDVDFEAQKLVLKHTELDQFKMVLSLQDDLIVFDPIEFSGPKGEKLHAKLDFSRHQENAQVDLEIIAHDFRFGISAVEGQEVSTIPPTDVFINVTGTGATYHELASSLNGGVRIIQGKGQVANAGLDLIFSDLLSELFTMLNPFAEKSIYTQLDCSVINADIVSGKVTVDPIIMQTEELTIVSHGDIDLSKEKLNLVFNTKLRKGIGISTSIVINPFIMLAGSLKKPFITLDPAGVAVTGTVAVATAGLSLIGKSLWDRFLSSRDPCGDALEKLEKKDAAKR